MGTVLNLMLSKESAASAPSTAASPSPHSQTSSNATRQLLEETKAAGLNCIKVYLQFCHKFSMIPQHLESVQVSRSVK
jgi:hypothetical protein